MSAVTIAHSAAKSNASKFFQHIPRFLSHTKDEFSEKEETKMNCHANKSIECTVQSCAYHCDSENYCSLERILVGTHEANPTVDQCTDCMSFKKR